MAHIEPRGMGGRRAGVDVLRNVALLCRLHHDMLDGRVRPDPREVAKLHPGVSIPDDDVRKQSRLMRDLLGALIRSDRTAVEEDG